MSDYSEAVGAFGVDLDADLDTNTTVGPCAGYPMVEPSSPSGLLAHLALQPLTGLGAERLSVGPSLVAEHVSSAERRIIVRHDGSSYTGPARYHVGQISPGSWAGPVSVPGMQIGIMVHAGVMRAIVLPVHMPVADLLWAVFPAPGMVQERHTLGLALEMCRMIRRDGTVHRKYVQHLLTIRQRSHSAAAFALCGAQAARQRDAKALGERERRDCLRVALAHTARTAMVESCHRCGSHREPICAGKLAGAEAHRVGEQVARDVAQGLGGDYLFCVLTLDQRELAAQGHNPATAMALFSDGLRGPWKNLMQRLKRAAKRWAAEHGCSAEVAYYRALEVHASGWPHWAVLIRSRALADALRAGLLDLGNMAEECGYGRTSADIVHNHAAISGELCKASQHPGEMSRGVHRFQPSTRFFARDEQETLKGTSLRLPQLATPSLPRSEPVAHTVIWLGRGLSASGRHACRPEHQEADGTQVVARVAGQAPTAAEWADLNEAEGLLADFEAALKAADRRTITKETSP